MVSRPPIQRVGIFARRHHPAAHARALELCRWLRSRGREVFVEEDFDDEGLASRRLPAAALKDHVELLVVLGGDGTLIHAAIVLAGAPIPIFGVNMGSLGFMTEIREHEMLPCLGPVLEGVFEVERRMKLDAALFRGEGPPIFEGQVLNDVVISKGALARIADIDARLAGTFVTTYLADGVIVATPTGSTAYSLSAGGPILFPALEAMVIAPICPHTLAQRPLVIPPDQPVELTLTSDNGEVFLTLDGQTGMAMQPGDRVEIRRSAAQVILVRNPELDTFSILRTKLRWGSR
jgi:NAD+ kinase